VTTPRLFTLLAAAAFVLSYSAPADAGLKANDPDDYVMITLGAHPNTSGGFGAVRNSADATQYIGCDLNVTTTGQSVFCYAHDSGTGQLACSSNLPNHVAAVKALQSASFLAFETDVLGITCTSIVVDNHSILSPKK
jgi:hypothetical protein